MDSNIQYSSIHAHIQCMLDNSLGIGAEVYSEANRNWCWIYVVCNWFFDWIQGETDTMDEKSDVLSGSGELEDSVRLGEPGWRERYYREKFEAKTMEEIEEIQRDVVRLPPYITISHCYYSFFVSEWGLDLFCEVACTCYFLPSPRRSSSPEWNVQVPNSPVGPFSSTKLECSEIRGPLISVGI